jgi:hypothetical protein
LDQLQDSLSPCAQEFRESTDVTLGESDLQRNNANLVQQVFDGLQQVMIAETPPDISADIMLQMANSVTTQRQLHTQIQQMQQAMSLLQTQIANQQYALLCPNLTARPTKPLPTNLHTPLFKQEVTVEQPLVNKVVAAAAAAAVATVFANAILLFIAGLMVAAATRVQPVSPNSRVIRTMSLSKTRWPATLISARLPDGGGQPWKKKTIKQYSYCFYFIYSRPTHHIHHFR